MEIPPFATSSLAAGLGQAPTGTPGEPAIRRRLRLADLDAHYHCSVIGTCLGTGALRKIMRRLSPSVSALDSDLDVHHDAVSVAIEGGAGAKAIGKALDEAHAATIRRFAAAADEAGLGRLWAEALKSGEVPGAYWALMTHPQSTPALQGRAFGDVHMLSHLVGAANRADIRRLVVLEARNGELQDQVDGLRNRLQDAVAQHEAEFARLRVELATARGAARAIEAPDDARDLRSRLAESEGRSAVQAARRQDAEREAHAAGAALDDARGQLERLRTTHADLHGEVGALEAELARTQAPDAAVSPLESRLRGMRLLYVGGRPSTLTAIRALAERAGAEWLHHDGGMEDRKGLLAAMLPRAHCVVFPVDCIDHDSMQQLKRLCARHGLPYRPLRTASVASFVAAMAAADDQAPLANGAALASRFCVRHG